MKRLAALVAMLALAAPAQVLASPGLSHVVNIAPNNVVHFGGTHCSYDGGLTCSTGSSATFVWIGDGKIIVFKLHGTKVTVLNEYKEQP